MPWSLGVPGPPKTCTGSGGHALHWEQETETCHVEWDGAKLFTEHRGHFLPSALTPGRARGMKGIISCRQTPQLQPGLGC